MNVAIREKIIPTGRTEIRKRNTTNKTPTRKIRSHVKIFPKNVNQKKSVQFVQDTEKKSSENDDHIFSQFGF